MAAVEPSVPRIFRIPREWDEPCRECRGTGTVHKRQHFALWTPDEFERGGPLGPEHDVPADAYVCTAAPGATIHEACVEAKEISAIVKRPVAFVFNGTVAVVREGDDTRELVERWWLKAYGKTYEQLMRDR